MPCKTKAKTKKVAKKTPRLRSVTVKKKKKTKVPKTKISAKLIKKLDEAKIKYEIIPHRVVFTAFDLAQTTGAKIQEITKTLVLKADKDYILALLPANTNLDLDKLKKLAQAKKISIVKEADMVKNLKVKPGAVHPFGSIFKLPVYIDNKVAKLTTAFFQPGSYTESIKMKVKDFISLEEPIKGAFSKAKKLPKPKMHKPKKKSVKKTTPLRPVKKVVKKVKSKSTTPRQARRPVKKAVKKKTPRQARGSRK